MPYARTGRLVLIATVSVALGACASGPDPFTRHATAYPSQAPASAICPVVLSNETDQQLDASYIVDGVQSLLGLIPAGRSLSFSVWCDGGAIEAHGVASGGFFADGQEYRTVARLDSSRATRLDFTTADRVR